MWYCKENVYGNAWSDICPSEGYTNVNLASAKGLINVTLMGMLSFPSPDWFPK